MNPDLQNPTPEVPLNHSENSSPTQVELKINLGNTWNTAAKAVVASLGVSFTLFIALTSFHEYWLDIHDITDGVELHDTLGWGYLIGGFILGATYIRKKSWNFILISIGVIYFLAILFQATGPYK